MINKTIETDKRLLVPVKPSDTQTLEPGCLGIACTGGGGVIRLADARDEPVSMPFALGDFIPVRATQVFETGTTATGIIAVYDRRGRTGDERRPR